jgi:hypothetical protein
MSLFGDNKRHLTKDEIDFIKTVFRSANLPPLEEIVITDGLSPTGVPFTDSDSSINIGPVLFAQDLSAQSKRPDGKVVPSEQSKTFVHEMTHVWQYFNNTLSRTHGMKAQTVAFFKDKAVGLKESAMGTARNLGLGLMHQPPVPISHSTPYIDKLYSFDTDGNWEDMGFEGQANMVEHWYASGKPEDGSYEHLFMKYLVWVADPTLADVDEKTGKELAVIEARKLTPPPLDPHSSVAYETRASLTDRFLVSLLKPRFGAKDVPGFGGREKRLESVFSTVNVPEAIGLYTRLVMQNRKDPVAVYFHDHLSTPTRKNLLRILQSRLAAKKSTK